MSKVDAVVIGAGVIGAAIAQRLASLQMSVVVLESHDRIGEGITSRNSGVIHAGIYYAPASLKANLCLRGKDLIYEWAASKGIPHRRTGKCIVATDAAQSAELERLYLHAQTAGATGLSWWAPSQTKEALPFVTASQVLFSGETGIIDPIALTESLLNDAASNEGIVLTGARVTGIEPCKSGYKIETERGPVEAERVFNAAGLHCDDIARLAGIDHFSIHPCRGDYFRVKTDLKINHLLYPVKARNAPGLGIHVTLELDGGIRLGPDAEYVSSKTDHTPRPEKLEEKLEVFRKAAEKLLGPLRIDQLSYDQCGLRPKLRGPQESEERDFVISEDLPGFINLVGIESPGLTASLAIAEYVHRNFL